VGGAGGLTGGLHKVHSLDMTFAAATSLRGNRYALKLSSNVGYGAQLVGTLQGLIGNRLVTSVGQDGIVQSYRVANRSFLHELRADLLDVDSVVVDLGALTATGTARLTVSQSGSATFAGGVEAVLFRDRDGDLRFTRGIDEELGRGGIHRLASGESMVVEFHLPLHAVRYPEEVYLAWIDAPKVPEVVVGEHTTLAGNPCLERKSMEWTRTIGEGRLLAHLRDSDGDGLVRPNDAMDTVLINQGRLCLRPSPNALNGWCIDAMGTGDISEIAIRDIDADGAPEILLGSRAVSRNGVVEFDLAKGMLPAGSIDLDEDGRIDQVHVSGECRSIRLSDGTMAWASKCPEVGSWNSLGQIARHPEGCTDVSVSGIDVEGDLVHIRLANAGTTDLPVGLAVVLRDTLGKLASSTQLAKPLSSGEVVKLLLPREGLEDFKVEVDVDVLTDHALLDFDSANNRGKWPVATETVP
jgi:hypothetical protein